MSESKEIVSHRKARFDYEIFETLEAGIALLGTEIKSLRQHGGSLQDAYVDIRSGEAFLVQASIQPYSFGNIHNHPEKRARKLLLHKHQIEKLARTVKEKGFVIIPLSIYLNKNGIAKVKIALAKGKKNYDKRASLKDKEHRRSIQREGE